MGACERLVDPWAWGVRRAALTDASAVRALLAPATHRGDLLALPAASLQRLLHPMGAEWCAFVALPHAPCEADFSADLCADPFAAPRGAPVFGFAGLRFWTPTHAEVRTLCVSDTVQGQGVGRLLLARLEEEARARGARTLFALTKRPGFFERASFVRTTKDAFPWKVSGDCAACAKRERCEEIAVCKEVS